MEGAALCACIPTIHTAFVSKERPLLVDRSCASELIALPSRIPLYLYMSVIGEFVTGRIWCFWGNFFDNQPANK